ncbi:MAG TPA: hypothetical protein VGJ71_07075 [Candidatus Limnocylindrales bacterium]|jgi:hypothetical protein
MTRGQQLDDELFEPIASDGPALRATASIRGRTNESIALVAGVTFFLALAIVKPWGAGTPAPAATARPEATRRVIAAAPATDGLADLRSHCDEPFAWRVYSRESQNQGMRFRVWSTVAPATMATSPLDPGVPLVQVGAQLEALGYCAPWSGLDAPPRNVTVRAWAVTPEGPDGPAARPLSLIAVAPAAPSPFTALYHLAVDAGTTQASALAARDWPEGRYVFAAMAAGWERWWAVEISRPAGTSSQARG